MAGWPNGLAPTLTGVKTLLDRKKLFQTYFILFYFILFYFKEQGEH
jgi:hypothetical protein